MISDTGFNMFDTRRPPKKEREKKQSKFGRVKIMYLKCPKCRTRDLATGYYIEGNTKRCNKCGHEFHPTAGLAKTRDYTPYKEIRPEIVEEIQAVWQSPKFKTHNQRLIQLFRYRETPESGITIRELAHGIYPKKMDMDTDVHSTLYADEIFKLIRQMIKRFNKDTDNHEVMLYPVNRKLPRDAVYRYYYYNMEFDQKGIEEVNARRAKFNLTMDRRAAEIKAYAEMSEEDYKKLVGKTAEERFKEIQDMVKKEEEAKQKEKEREAKEKQEKIEKAKRENYSLD